MAARAGLVAPRGRTRRTSCRHGSSRAPTAGAAGPGPPPPGVFAVWSGPVSRRRGGPPVPPGKRLWAGCVLTSQLAGRYMAIARFRARAAFPADIARRDVSRLPPHHVRSANERAVAQRRDVDFSDFRLPPWAAPLKSCRAATASATADPSRPFHLYRPVLIGRANTKTSLGGRSQRAILGAIGGRYLATRGDTPGRFVQLNGTCLVELVLTPQTADRDGDFVLAELAAGKYEII